jgi:thiol-disulfide isomerase/thioredoxin
MSFELAPDALAIVAAAAALPSRRVALRIHPGTAPSELGRRLAETAHEVELRTGGLVPVSFDPAGDGGLTPALAVLVGPRVAVRYHAVPEGPEEGPFVELLLDLARCSEAPPGEATALPPTELEVFIASGCPNCPTAVRAALALAAASPGLSVVVIDVAELPERAGEVGVRSVPMIVASGGLTVVGAISAAELAARLAESRGPAGAAVVLESYLEAGRFAAAGELLAAGRGHEAFLERWRGGGLERRMGLALAADEALQRDPGALDALVPGLLRLLGPGDVARRGDTADLLGRIGHPAARPDLEAMRAEADEDLAEAAAEALLGLDARQRSDPSAERAG